MMKIILIPIYVVLIVIKTVLGLLIRLSDWVFYAIGGLLLLVTALSYYFGLESGDSIRNMIIGSGTFLLIPQAAGLIEGFMEFCTMIIGDKMGGR